ncbi:MAG: hypothetical protein M1821_001277 [Bathelium mastoideum]|nr:MAG: hypothetical protein M1821_001277 [Bathelium mastoideum]
MTSRYDNNHRAFLQAFLSHSSLTLSAARPILAAIQTAHDPDRPTLPNDVTNEDILSHIHTVNSAITAFDLEIRSAKPQTHDAGSESRRRESESESIAGHASSGERVYALVNASADPAAQLATTYTAEELAYIKRVLDAMFDTYNTRRAELCAVTGIQAAQLHKAPRNNGTANGRESTAASGLSQSGQAQSITMSQAERVLASLVEAGWFNRSKKGFYTLSARGLMELRGWLVDTYNEPADEGEGEDAVEKVKSCHACKEIVIVPGGLSGTLLVATNPDAARSIIGQDMAYVSCDPAFYPGNIDALGLLNQVQSQNVRAVILYSITSMTCNYTAGSNSPASPFIYSMSSMSDSQTLYNETTGPSDNGWTPATAIIQQTANSNNTNAGQDGGGGGSLGPSPSTAVAMIILYSITGVITALFLIIIVTGAVRAHRHPERYGPRNVAGRTRQSRAKGLARAMLETLPIVKFGERAPDKDAVVELGAASRDPQGESRDQSTEAISVGGQRESERKSAEHGITSVEQMATGHKDGSVSAETAAGASINANAPAAQAGEDDKDGLGCSICTEDFERGQDIRVLPCDHKFHPACIDPWLLNVSGTCPLCRVDLRPPGERSSGDNAEGHGVGDGAAFAPPLAETEETEGGAGNRPTRRMTMLRSVLHLRTAEERAAALRELRDEQEEGERQEVAESHDTARRRNRLSTRLQDVFRVRTRRGANAVAEEPSSSGREADTVEGTNPR